MNQDTGLELLRLSFNEEQIERLAIEAIKQKYKLYAIHPDTGEYYELY